MLIDDEIKAHLASGALTRLELTEAWEKEVRVMLLCEPLVTALQEARNSDDDKVIERYAQLDADLQHYVKGGRIDTRFMKWLRPKKHEVWVIMSKRPQPSLRVFGRFLKAGWFVATHVEERKGLKGYGSSEYAMQKVICESHWNKLLSTSPFSTPQYADYITGNASETPKVLLHD